MKRKGWTVLSLVVAGALVVAYAVSSSETPVEKLEKQVAALEAKVGSLEKQIQSLRVQVVQGAGGTAAAAASPLENEAQVAFGEITRLANNGQAEQAKSKLVEFQEKYGATKIAPRAAKLGQDLAVVGKTSPPSWKIDKWFQGEKNIQLGSPKTTLVVFFEEWCPHCKTEMPQLQKVYTDLKGQGLQIIGLTKVTKSSTDEKVQAFITDKAIQYPVAKETGELSEYFGVAGIPAAAVVKNGKVIWRGHPANLSPETLKGWL